jgi:hypothetical protein
MTMPGWALPSYRRWQRWGWPGQTGCALLLLSGLGWGLGLPWLQAQVDGGAKALDSARRAALFASRAAAPDTLQSGPAQFLAELPAAKARPGRIADLLNLAAQHGLALQRSEFQLSAEPGVGFDQYSVTLPATAAYPNLHAFIAAALAADDALSLDALRLSRETPNSALVQAELHFTLFGRLPERPEPR